MARPQIRKLTLRIFNQSINTAGTLLCSADRKESDLKRAISGFDTAKLKRSLRQNASPSVDNPKQQAEPNVIDTSDAEMILTLIPFNLHKKERFNNRCKAVCIVFTTKQLHLVKKTTIN